MPCPWPLSRVSVNGPDDDAPAGIGTDPGLTDKPSVGDKVTSMSDPDQLGDRVLELVDEHHPGGHESSPCRAAGPGWPYS